MEEQQQSFHPHAHQNRRERRRLIYIGVIVTFILGFCIVPWVFFGGLTLIEDLFRAILP